MYCIFPAVFYGLPILIFRNNGVVRLHFFQTFDVPVEDMMKIGLGHLVVGSLLVYSLKNIRLTQKKLHKSNVLISFIIIVLFFAQLYIPLSYLRAVIPMIIIALLKLFFDYDRYPMIVVFLLYILPWLSRKNLPSQVLLMVIGLFSMVFILQPLRAGLVPFSEGFNSLIYLYYHLNPIYIAAFLCMNEDFGWPQLLGETVPLGKTIFGLTTVIDIIGVKYLPKNIFELGTRHGSNMSMYFASWYGMLILGYVILILNRILSTLKDKSILNPIVVLLILNAPYFMRRTLGALFIDICILIIVSIFINSLLKSVGRYSA